MHFSTPQSNRPQTGIESPENKTWQFLLNEITIKVPKCTKIWDISVQFLQIWGLFPIFKVFPQSDVLTSNMTVVNFCHNISVKCSRYHDTGAIDLSQLSAYSTGDIIILEEMAESSMYQLI